MKTSSDFLLTQEITSCLEVLKGFTWDPGSRNGYGEETNLQVTLELLCNHLM